MGSGWGANGEWGWGEFCRVRRGGMLSVREWGDLAGAWVVVRSLFLFLSVRRNSASLAIPLGVFLDEARVGVLYMWS